MNEGKSYLNTDRLMFWTIMPEALLLHTKISTRGEVLVLFKWLADLRWLRCSPDSIPGTALSLAKAKRQNCRALLTAQCG